MANEDPTQEKLPVLLPAPRTPPPHALAGMAALVLIFFASASFTVAYLSNWNPAAAASAAAAAAAESAAQDSFAHIELMAQSAYVLDLTTGQVLYAKNPDVQLPLASLAKVPLVLAVSKVVPGDSIVTIPPHETPDGSSVRLPAGLRFHVQDLIDFTLVASSNEGAEILAEAAASAVRAAYPMADGSAPVLWRMNDIARTLGLTHTYFLNTNGLDLSPTQASAYGSAHDVALMFAFAASTSLATFEQTARDTITIRATTGESITGVNTDEALPSIPGLIMGKTGSTPLAGGNLAVIFEVGPSHPVVAVVLHSTLSGRFEDMKALVAATAAAIAQQNI